MSEIAKIETFQQIETFQKSLNTKGEVKSKNFKDEMKKPRKDSTDYEFIPIGELEKTLDEKFSGLWETENEVYTLQLNTIICTLKLRVFNPAAKIWLSRPGAGGAQLQLRKGEKEITPYSLNHNAVRFAYKIAKEDATKNAAKSLGEVFGRNLNRDIVSEYETLTEFAERYDAEQIQKHEYRELTDRLIALLQNHEKLTDKQKAAKITKVQSGTLTREIMLQTIKQLSNETE
jgi:hypothetical protein